MSCLFVIFSKTPKPTSPRPAFFYLPQRTITRSAARTGPVQTGGMFAVVHLNYDVRGLLITRRPGPNSHVTNANVYEKRWRYTSLADLRHAPLAQAANAAVACATPDQWQKPHFIVPDSPDHHVRVISIYISIHPFSGESGLTGFA